MSDIFVKVPVYLSVYDRHELKEEGLVRTKVGEKKFKVSIQKDDTMEVIRKKLIHICNGIVSRKFSIKKTRRDFPGVRSECGHLGLTYQQWNNEVQKVVEGIEDDDDDEGYFRDGRIVVDYLL